MPYVAVLNYYDPLTTSETSVMFATGPGIAFTDTTWAAPGLMKWASPTAKIGLDANGVVSLTTDQGEIDITNLPETVSQAGAFDALTGKIFHGRTATLYYVPGNLWSARTLVDSGILEQPIVNFALGTSVTGYLAFILRDPRSTLTANLQGTLYAGTNSGATGVEGTTADLKGKPKPIMYGRVSNIPGVRVNSSTLIYQLADVAGFVDCVRDGGLALTVGTVRGSLALLQSTSPTAGTYDTYAGTEGTFVRLGSTPQATLTFDAYEGTNASDRTVAQIWNRMRQQRCGTASGSIDATSITAADTADSGESGVWFSDVVTQLDALDTVLAGFSGFEVFSAASLWKIQKLTVPLSTATTVVDIAMLSVTELKTSKARDATSISFVRPDYTPDGAIPWQINVQWGQNYQIMAATDFNGASIQRLKDKFADQWRTATASNTATWNPATNTGPWKNAPSFTMSSNYQAQSDGTCPAAAAEATRLLGMFGVARSQWEVGIIPEVGDLILPGDIVSFTIPQYSLSAGALFRVLQSSLLVDATGIAMGLIIGLQRQSTDP